MCKPGPGRLQRIYSEFVGVGIVLFCVLTTVAVRGQSNSIVATNSTGAQSNSPQNHVQDVSAPDSSADGFQRSEKIRAACIGGRRLVCGRILDVLPEGLVVESGYTNLLREPLARSWLIPGTVEASRAENLVEGKNPGAICVGRVLLTNTPKGKKFKPAKYDYVIVEAYPAGEYNYTSSVGVQRTIRKFSANLPEAIAINLEAGGKTIR